MKKKFVFKEPTFKTSSDIMADIGKCVCERGGEEGGEGIGKCSNTAVWSITLTASWVRLGRLLQALNLVCDNPR